MGATEVICTDKTGTLTTNKMEVIKIFTNNETINLKDIKKYPELMDIMMFCNNATSDGGEFTGDSVEVALSNFLTKNKVNILKKIKENKRKLELPFDSNRKMMSTIYDKDGKEIIYTKGGLEAILKSSSHILINGKEEK